MSNFASTTTGDAGAQAAGRAVGGLEAKAPGLLGAGARNTSAGADYYKALLGSPAQMQAAVAPAEKNIGETIAGATAGAKAGYQQGTARDTTLGRLALGRTSAIGNLYTGVQPAAASALAGIGQTQTGQGIGAFTGASSGGTALAGQQSQQAATGSQLSMGAGMDWGKLASQAIKLGMKAGVAA